MIPTFEDALNDLLDKYRPNTALDDLVSALVLRLMALREEQDERDDE